MRRALAAAAVALVLPLSAVAPAHAAPRTGPPARPAASSTSAIPMLAYYYIWFQATSWNRAKIDTPLLGRYTSDERSVMQTQIRQAKSVGITGFLVSWKDTPVLTERLKKLTEVARAERFKLGIVYEGLDFHRKPLPFNVVSHDLQALSNLIAGDPVYRIFQRPLVVWTGIGDLDPAAAARVTKQVRSHLLVLGSAKNVKSYKRIASAVDGDAYYWSSVKPASSTLDPKLSSMAAAVHDAGGLWIAPAAPGFDARLVGGHSVVPRDNGQTLRRELQAAYGSSPDAVGIISWNEWSENTYVEPSRKYGSTSLHVIAQFSGRQLTAADQPADSSAGSGGKARSAIPPVALVCGLIVLLTAVPLTIRRRRSSSPSGS